MRSGDWQKPSHSCWLASPSALQPKSIKPGGGQVLLLISQPLKMLVETPGSLRQGYWSPQTLSEI